MSSKLRWPADLTQNLYRGFLGVEASSSKLSEFHDVSLPYAKISFSASSNSGPPLDEGDSIFVADGMPCSILGSSSVWNSQ